VTRDKDTPEIIPNKLESHINYKIIAIIIVGVIAFQIYLSYIVDDPTSIVYVSGWSITLAVAIVSFATAKKYSGIGIYGKSYIALGIGFIGFFLGDFTYFIYEEVLEVDPYPSIADVFYYSLYIGIIVYLFIHIRFFTKQIQTKDKVTIAIISLISMISYSLISASEIGELNFDYFYGIVFVSIVSVTLGLSVYGFRIFQKGIVSTTWILLTVGILLFAVGDSWYYYIELFEGYDLRHPVISLWYVGQFFIMYSLLQHRKTLQ
jgi:hypothetical protein